MSGFASATMLMRRFFGVGKVGVVLDDLLDTLSLVLR